MNNKKSLSIEIFGWYGAIGLLFAFALSNFGVFNAENFWYQLINFTAASGISTVSFYKKAYQPGCLNAVWALVAFFGVLKTI